MLITKATGSHKNTGPKLKQVDIAFIRLRCVLLLR